MRWGEMRTRTCTHRFTHSRRIVYVLAFMREDLVSTYVHLDMGI